MRTTVTMHHFRHGEPRLAVLLVADLVRVHPLVLGEIACGTPPSRHDTLRWLGQQRQPLQATLPEVLALVEREHLFGLGCGLVGVTLLASALITPGARLWTRDKALHTLAERFHVAHT